MRLRKRFTAFLAFFLCTALLLTVTAAAAYYSTYTSIDPQLESPNSCTGAQGFDVGSTYAYTIKTNTGTYDRAIIYRTKLSDGSTTLMTNSNGTNYLTSLYHGNDMVLCTVGSTYCMFVATMDEGSMSFVKLTYSGTVYSRVGNYTIQYNGANLAVTGVKITSKDATNIYFLFKNGRNYYRGTLPLNNNSGTINVSLAFTVDVGTVVINGSPVTGLSSYLNQGFEYYNNSVFHILTEPSGNVSIVLVYHNIDTASGTIYSDQNLSFRITSGDYSLFEIEGCGHAGDGKLYFNTNRVRASDGVAFDGVHYFNGYTG